METQQTTFRCGERELRVFRLVGKRCTRYRLTPLGERLRPAVESLLEAAAALPE